VSQHVDTVVLRVRDISRRRRSGGLRDPAAFRVPSVEAWSPAQLQPVTAGTMVTIKIPAEEETMSMLNNTAVRLFLVVGVMATVFLCSWLLQAGLEPPEWKCRLDLQGPAH